VVVTISQQSAATGDPKICFGKNGTTRILPPCASAAPGVACQLSFSRTGTLLKVTARVPAGDPTFRLVVPGGRLLWPSTFPVGKVNTPYAAHMQASGGKAPFRWKVASGKLAAGLKLNATTGAITGKPTTKGVFRCVVNSTDSESPPKVASIGVQLTMN
jgi:hypothetical protein